MKKTMIASAITGFLLTSSAFAAQIAAEGSNAAASDAAVPAASSEMATAVDTLLRDKFNALDKNRDGKIDKMEARADKQLSRDFKQITKKGKLDEAGYINWQQAQKPRG